MIPKEFYIPHSIELLFDFFSKLGIDINREHTKRDKKKVLKVIDALLKQKIIHVYSIDKEFDDSLKRFEITNKEILKRIDEMWFEGAKFPDFYNMVWFGYEKWYIDALNDLGMPNFENWESFVKQKIGDLEQWIEENKPKE